MNHRFENKDGVECVLTFRPVEEKDRDYLYRVVSSTVCDQVRMMGGDIRQMEPLLQMQFEGQNRTYKEEFPNATHQIISLNGIDIGRVYINRTPEEIRILDITILPDYRGKGAGTYILKLLEEESRENNIPILVHVETGNPSMRLFRRLGYQFKEKCGEMHHLLEWRS